MWPTSNKTLETRKPLEPIMGSSSAFGNLLKCRF